MVESCAVVAYTSNAPMRILSYGTSFLNFDL